MCYESLDGISEGEMLELMFMLLKSAGKLFCCSHFTSIGSFN